VAIYYDNNKNSDEVSYYKLRNFNLGLQYKYTMCWKGNK